MHFSSWYVHDITNLQLSRLLAFRTNEAGAHRHCEDLTAFVGVPEGASARCEADIIAHGVLGAEDRIHVDGAGEGLGRLTRRRVWLVRGTYELHGLVLLCVRETRPESGS